MTELVPLWHSFVTLTVNYYLLRSYLGSHTFAGVAEVHFLCQEFHGSRGASLSDSTEAFVNRWYMEEIEGFGGEGRGEHSSSHWMSSWLAARAIEDAVYLNLVTSAMDLARYSTVEEVTPAMEMRPLRVM